MRNPLMAFSSTGSKKEQALKMGAANFASTKGKTELSVPVKINHLLVTASRSPDWNLVMPIMAARSTICPLTLPDPSARLDIPHVWVLLKGLKVFSTMPKKSSYGDMLEFATVADRDELTKEGIEKSMEKLRKGEARYRGVCLLLEKRDRSLLSDSSRCLAT